MKKLITKTIYHTFYGMYYPVILLVKKLKQLNITKREWTVIILIICSASWYLLYSVTLPLFDKTLNTHRVIKVAQASEETKIGSKEWILDTIEKAGIDPIKAYCLIEFESRWRVDAKNINAGGTIDLGLFQWNSHYQIETGFISLGCIGNPECETHKFIEKVLKDKGFGAWHGYTNNCTWLGTNPFTKLIN